MSKTYIYLAGPITGMDLQGAVDWRNMIDAHLHDMNPNFVGVSPLRCEPPQDDGRYLEPGAYSPALAQEITAKNLLDVKRCDLVMAYLPHLSIGTLQEIGWSVGLGKPVIVLTSRDDVLGNPILMATVPFLFDCRKGGWKKAMGTIDGLFGVYT
jgi:nucleoside 2-deoxyribosyltransferase